MAKAVPSRTQASLPALAAFAIAIAAAATLAGAWYFELAMGLEPCPLCLEQRVPYYVAIPLALALGWLATLREPSAFLAPGLASLAAILAAGAALGLYHAGIEWGWWSGPAACAAGPSAGPVSDILGQLKSRRVVPCNEAAWRFLGISLAGYNVLIAGALAALALGGSAVAFRERLASIRRKK